ncbi:hypothetical protein Hypma_001984 [Hypsizygus marmoreus]|uniref:Uncharacterized protein n=1 Tax=Hypsizygus marmoreus TaxID=39966 RepID=A0A369JE70_HYPMA|nr:hypothetical protein Hypma_001984 [Hypsizygus marmoreus]
MTTGKVQKTPPTHINLVRLVDMFAQTGDLVIQSEKQEFPEPENTDLDLSEEEINERAFVTNVILSNLTFLDVSALLPASICIDGCSVIGQAIQQA